MSERNIKISLRLFWRRAYARNVRLRFLYRQYINFLYFDLYLNTAYTAHYIYITVWIFLVKMRSYGIKWSFQQFNVYYFKKSSLNLSWEVLNCFIWYFSSIVSKKARATTNEKHQQLLNHINIIKILTFLLGLLKCSVLILYFNLVIEWIQRPSMAVKLQHVCIARV